MFSETGGNLETMFRSPIFPSYQPDAVKFERIDPMLNQLCRVCDEPAAGFHFGAFTCEGCKSFFGRTCNNQSVIQECKNNYSCVVDKKNRTACKACRLRKCLMVGMSKSGSRYGRRSNWFKIHCLMQQASSSPSSLSTPGLSPASTSSSTSLTCTEIEKKPLTSSVISPLSSPPSVSAGISSPFKCSSPSSVSTEQQQQLQQNLCLAPPNVRPLTSNLYSPLSLMTTAAAFPNVPFQKQALLSPLLAAHTQLLHTAIAAQANGYPIFGSSSEQLEYSMTEQKVAFLEHLASLASLANTETPPMSSSSPESPQHLPMDLSISCSSNKKSKKEDLNKNILDDCEAVDEKLS